MKLNGCLMCMQLVNGTRRNLMITADVDKIQYYFWFSFLCHSRWCGCCSNSPSNYCYSSLFCTSLPLLHNRRWDCEVNTEHELSRLTSQLKTKFHVVRHSFLLSCSLSLLSYLSIPTTNRVECCRIGRSGSFFCFLIRVCACVLSVFLLIFVNDSNHTNLVIVRTPDREIPTAHNGCVYDDVVVIAFGRQLWNCNV